MITYARDDCAFCAIASGEAPADVVRVWPEALAIVPINPCVEGHVLVIPRAHLTRANYDSLITGATAARATQYAADRDVPFNLIVNSGAEAGQTVWHLHWHYVPRRDGDGLLLPWSLTK